MTAPSVLTVEESGVLTVTFNRPERLNAIDTPMTEALLHVIESGSKDPRIRVMCLRGAGRAFCAGRDISAPPTDRDHDLVQAVSLAIVRSPKPVVAMVHGWVVGAGLEWMLNADIVLAENKTRFKLPEASLGVFVTGGLSLTLSANIGLARAKALMLLGQPFDAPTALAWGLIWRTTDASDMDREATEVCARLSTLKPSVATEFKRTLNNVGLARFDQAIDAETFAQRRLAAVAN